MVGAGLMGAGIAYVAAKAGVEVVLIDRDAEAAEKGKAYSATLMERGRARPRHRPRHESCCKDSPTPIMVQLTGCDLVIEAVFEDKVKADAPRRSQALGRKALLASNTSTLADHRARGIGSPEFRRHSFLLARGPHAARGDHPGQNDGRRGAGGRHRFCPRDPQDPDCGE